MYNVYVYVMYSDVCVYGVAWFGWMHYGNVPILWYMSAPQNK